MTPTVAEVLRRGLLFVGGKGGVGKTAVSQAIAQTHASQGRRTLWVTFEDPARPKGELKQVSRSLWHLNCEAGVAFEEYAALKIGAPKLTRLFTQNKLMRYLSQAAPGIHELVLLGKVWHERTHYDRVVVDMPSTGYGLAMFQSADNFAKLFKGGPIHHDAEAMLGTFKDPKQSGHLIVSLPEEMPLVESLELNDYLLGLFPDNPPALLVNRLFPGADSERASSYQDQSPPHAWENPLASSALDYALKRAVLENHNLKIWKDRALGYGELEMIPPPGDVVAQLAQQITDRSYA